MDWDILKDVLAGLISGSIGGALVAHILAQRRDANNRKELKILSSADRKRNFVSFVRKWRSRATRDNPRMTAGNMSEMVSLFEGEAAKITADYTGTEFEELVRAVSSLRDSDVEEGANQGENAPGRRKLLTRLDAIINFVAADY
jgi:hypothetical protein